MQIILLSVFIILLIVSGILIRNRFTFEPLVSPVPNVPESNKELLPLLSVCIPARNEEENIERCIESLMFQDYPNYEILVLDDRSTDHTPQIL